MNMRGHNFGIKHPCERTHRDLDSFTAGWEGRSGAIERRLSAGGTFLIRTVARLSGTFAMIVGAAERGIEAVGGEGFAKVG